MYQIKALDQTVIEQLKSVLNCDNFFAKLLVSKGFDLSSTTTLLHLEKAILSPYQLTNMAEAVEKILSFIKTHNECRLFIFGDFDVDGITSTFILRHALLSITKALNANCIVYSYLPDRSEGYGISENFCNCIDNSIPSLVITVDNGTNAVDSINILNQKQIPVIVTDHHQAEETIADCLIINPHVFNDVSQEHLSGCGVAFKLGLALQQAIGINTMHNVMDLLCLGTIGDMMPMTLENIAFCYYGLNLINTNTAHPAIQFLKNADTLNYKDLAYDIVPKINSCGRMGNMNLAHDYFLNPTEEMAERIADLNLARKEKVKKCIEACSEQKESIIIFDENISGIGGIIAGQLSKRNERNTIVLSRIGNTSLFKGSARNYNDNVLKSIKQFFKQFPSLKASGHEEACGVQIDESELYAFKKAYEQMFFEQSSSVNQFIDSIEEEPVSVDLAIDFSEINVKNLRIVKSLPYDTKCLTEPIFITTANLLEKEPTKSNPDNMWFVFEKNKKRLKIWGRNLTQRGNSLKSKRDLKVICTLENDFMKPGNVTLGIIDIIE